MQSIYLTMEKEALLSIILNDLKEVEVLVQTFSGKPHILPPFIKLAIQKIDNIRQEIELLDALQPDVAVVPPPIGSAVVPPVAEIRVEPVVCNANTVSAEKDGLPKKEEGDVANSAQMTDKFEIEDAPRVVQQVVVDPVVSLRAEVGQPLANTDPIREVLGQVPSADTKPAHAHPAHHQPKHPTTLGETLVTDKSSVLDKIHSVKEVSNPAMIGKPVEDIKKAIGINDRFLYQRELFANNSSLMGQTIDELNLMTSFADAQSFIKANFDWDFSDDTVESFLNLVRRRFK